MINLYTLLANPISGNGRSLRALPEIERVMKDFSLDYHVEYTREPGDATSIAEKAVQNKEDGIVVVGGDGTVFETLGGMAGSQTQLIYAPTGTGNDFVKALRLPLDAAKAVRQQLAARVRALDYALVNKTPFMNVCGTGFDVVVLRKLTAYKDRFQGIKAYLLALKDALGSYRPIDPGILDARRDGARHDRAGDGALRRQPDRGGAAAGHHTPDTLQQNQTLRVMKREGIAYGPVIGYTALLIAASGALGWVVTGSWYPLAILLVPVIGIAAYRLIGLYSDSIRRVTFMFNAIDNDDFTFRFHEDPSKVDNGMLNAALNRIKEILVRAKVRAEERERYYQLIMEYARTGLITINDAGSVYQANGEALRIFGLPRLTHIQQLELPAPEAYRVLTTIRPGEKHHVSCVTETGEMGLSLGCSQIVLEKRRLRVVVVSDINSELSEMQIESWSKLTRILTHEIMNSLAPITSLSDTLLHIDRTMNADVAHGLDTISATSRRLMAFVENFRRFTKIPAPQKAPFEVRELLEHAMTLIATEGIRIRLDVEPADTMIYADQMLVGQVVVNLLKNAREAVGTRRDACIEITSRIDPQENVVIEISNNGGAIPAEVTENIFTPFFTTKPDGSGIGLSVSRRIMQLHNGSLRLTANTDNRVTFTLLFG